MKLFLSLLVILIVSLPEPSLANDFLTFKKPSTYKEFNALSLVETDAHPALSLRIASVDLNDDFIDEYILKTTKCRQSRLCTYTIIAFMNKKPRIIGQFDAHKINVTEKKDYGIKRLIVYYDLSNDFVSRALFWRPFQFRYEY